MVQMILETRRSAEAVYRGTPGSGGAGGKAVVTVDGEPLLLRRELGEFSDGFNWGYGGAGPAQLALAVLADAAGEQVALKDW